MFREISSAAHSPSLASPFTRPPKPTPLNSINSTSLLQMFRKISSAAADADADAHCFASPSTRPPKPTPLNSINSTSRFTIPTVTIRVSTAKLQKFLQTDCKSGDVSADEAFCFFHRMVQMKPRIPLYSFNLLLWGLAENERYYDVLLLYGKMNSVGLIPNFDTLNILLKCLCYANRVCYGFLVMGRIIRMGYSPNIETFNSLFEGLILVNRYSDAILLYRRLDKNFACFPDDNSGNILIRAIYGPGYSINSRTFKEEKVGVIDIYDHYIDGLCKTWTWSLGKAKELFSDVDVPGHQPLSVNPMAEHVKGQEELKSCIHSKNTCLDWETLLDRLNQKLMEDMIGFRRRTRPKPTLRHPWPSHFSRSLSSLVKCCNGLV